MADGAATEGAGAATVAGTVGTEATADMGITDMGAMDMAQP